MRGEVPDQLPALVLTRPSEATLRNRRNLRLCPNSLYVMSFFGTYLQRDRLEKGYCGPEPPRSVGLKGALNSPSAGYRQLTLKQRSPRRPGDQRPHWPFIARRLTSVQPITSGRPVLRTTCSTPVS